MHSSIRKLQKFLQLESERGYDNRAVVGGLDKILPAWLKEALENQVEQRLIDYVAEKIKEYAEQDKQGRRETINDLLSELKELAPQTHPPAPKTDPPKPEAQPVAEPTESPAPSKPTENRPKVSSVPESERVALNAPLTTLSGIGKRYAQTFSKLGLNTLVDLLYYFPRRYDDYSKLKPINRLEYGDELTVLATVQSSSSRKIRNGRLTITEVVVSDGTGFLRLTWFNQPWIANRMKPGLQLVLSGKIDMYLGQLVMNNPEWEPLEKEHLHTNRIVPVYPLTAKITQRWLRRMMHQTATFWAPRIHDFMPEKILQSARLLDLANAIAQIHFPDSFEQLKAARNRLSFDEIFLLQLGVLSQKRNWQEAAARIFEVPDEWLAQRINQLPFELTGAQKRAIEDLRADLLSGQPMNRLLQGDVGSGKTIIAAIGMAIVAEKGAQSAIMAPTSILAEQHYRKLLELLSNTSIPSKNVVDPNDIRLLIGDTPEAEKKEIRQGLEDGNIKIVVGTHALLEGPVQFKNLHFAVIDEQHRFGVAQRANLRAKGKNLHLLVMTATPIPRSLALTVYGDLDLSVMDEMPVGRQPTETRVLYPHEREQAYQLIRSQAEKGFQSFIIYPLVEAENEKQDKRQAAVQEYERLQADVFPQFKLGLMHGRLKPDEKDRIMSSFRNREFDILVSTSVVEVGVDIPNATAMIIESANRFGLSQLHQFRGRIGRSEAKSYCALIPENENAAENERLTAMVETNDCFVLAERDLEQR
ncbi:MAG: ATP-dependent DNA helicase RecG, partial [Anaerolineaceae bacterium]|nr:ATP-dependent DNA helicase RecG [Anaerolineaceae bacterium]